MLFLIECSCFFYKCILYENYFNILRMMFGDINYVLYLLYLWILISFYFYVFIELNDVFGNYKWFWKVICDSNVIVLNCLRFFIFLWIIFK